MATTEQVWALYDAMSPSLRPAVLLGAFAGLRVPRDRIDGFSPAFRFHDLRHYFASLLISSGLDVKVVQARLRHASAMTTLNTYGHLWPDSDQASRTVVEKALRPTDVETQRDGD